jgi:peptide chain release factor 2
MDQLTHSNLTELKSGIEETVASLDIEAKRSRMGELENEALKADFWKDQGKAKSVMSEIEMLRREIKTAEELTDSVNTLLELFNSSSEKDIESLLPDYLQLLEKYKSFQTLKFLSGKYDNQAAILSIHAGQGGTEANDWSEMLLRMYTRYCERNGWKFEIIHMVPGSEAGISTATIQVEGDYAFGKLKREAGTHRLIRLSPFNAQSLRQTSFAGVEVIPIVPETDDDIQIKESDLEFKAVRASGAGGQKVNKTSSAVQITHLPTGISVHSSTQRDQVQNRKAAMAILKAKLWQIEDAKRETELRNIKGEHKIAGWGNQIRNYVLHPYKLVKDLRTEVESTAPEEVLDGNLDEFIEAEIRIQ